MKLIDNVNPKTIEKLNLYDRYEKKTFTQLAKSKPGQKLKTNEKNIVKLLNQYTGDDMIKMHITLLANDELLNGDLANNFVFVSSQVITLFKNGQQLKSLEQLKEIVEKHTKVEAAIEALSTVKFKEDRTKTIKENFAALADLLKQSDIQLPAGISVDVHGSQSFVSVDETLEQSTRIYEYIIAIKLNGVGEYAVRAGAISLLVEDVDELYNNAYRDVIVGPQ